MSQPNQEMRTNQQQICRDSLSPELNQYSAVNPECKSTSEKPSIRIAGFPFANPLVGR